LRAFALDYVRGDATGLAIPAHGEALRAVLQTYGSAQRSSGRLTNSGRGSGH
jgi:hypothetical protein